MNIPLRSLFKNLFLKIFDELRPAYEKFRFMNKFDLNFITHGSADPQIFKPFARDSKYY